MRFFVVFFVDEPAVLRALSGGEDDEGDIDMEWWLSKDTTVAVDER